MHGVYVSNATKPDLEALKLLSSLNAFVFIYYSSVTFEKPLKPLKILGEILGSFWHPLLALLMLPLHLCLL